jgi:hypothetical protein
MRIVVELCVCKFKDCAKRTVEEIEKETGARERASDAARQQLWPEERKIDGHVLCATLAKDHPLS